MVLAGHISDFPLSELLFFLSSKRRSGQLILKHPSMTITFTVKSGRLIAATSDVDHQRLGERLVTHGLLTPERLYDALALQSQEEFAPLGTVLVRHGYVDQETIQRVLRAQIADCLFQFLISPSGTFSFQSDIMRMSGINIEVNVEREVLEAISRADEWIAGHLDHATLRLNPHLAPDMLEPIIAEDWDLFEAMLDDMGTVDDIVERTGWPRERTVGGVLRMHAHGIVSVIYNSAA
jgi:hypothetical protein